MKLSKAICEAIKSYDPEIIVMGLSGSEMIHAAKDLGLKQPAKYLQTAPMKKTEHL